MSQFTNYNKTRLNDRQITELIGLSRGLIADGELTDNEVEYLLKWLVANEVTTKNPFIQRLMHTVSATLEDGVVDDEERSSLFDVLQRLSGGTMELGETLKSSPLPLCEPAPTVSITGKSFAFTGTCSFGARKACEAAVTERGGSAGSLTQKTDFLVIGEYASDDWIHSSYGRKIEKAVSFRDEKRVPIHIISEMVWQKAL